MAITRNLPKGAKVIALASHPDSFTKGKVYELSRDYSVKKFGLCIYSP